MGEDTICINKFKTLRILSTNHNPCKGLLTIINNYISFHEDFNK